MSRQRILVVHDEPSFTDAVKDTLTDLGFEVDVAIDPGDAIERLVDRRPDLVCINLHLPRDSGYELCELIRGDESLEKMLIVIMSDDSSPADIAYAEEAGANVFLRLPSPSKSLESLASHLSPLLEGTPPTSTPDAFRLRPSSP